MGPNSQSSKRYALITPSYRGDFLQCQLLVESVERFVYFHHFMLIQLKLLSYQLLTENSPRPYLEQLTPQRLINMVSIKLRMFQKNASDLVQRENKRLTNSIQLLRIEEGAWMQ